MKTDELIELLRGHVEPVDHRQIVRHISLAVAASTMVAAVIVLALLGPRTGLASTTIMLPALLKIGATLVMLVPALVYLVRVARPGGEQNTSIARVVLPFIAVMLLAAVSLALAPNHRWNGAILGDEWFECVVSIPLIAVILGSSGKWRQPICLAPAPLSAWSPVAPAPSATRSTARTIRCRFLRSRTRAQSRFAP